MKAETIAALEQKLGYRFRRPDLIVQALTHSSQARELESAQTAQPAARVGDNEQLEFLGDAVLSLVTSDELFRRFPEFREGQLSKLRAHLVSERHLIQVAQRLEIGDFLRLGRGEEKSGGRQKTAVLVDALEAVLAAMYLDGGLELARDFILQQIVTPELEKMALEGNAAFPITDFKSALQERMQAYGGPQPAYTLVKEEGPEHRKTFTVEVRLRGSGSQDKADLVGRATGPTKKRAEQDAARQLLERLIPRAPRSAKVESKDVRSAQH
jgi:ribonuclease III